MKVNQKNKTRIGISLLCAIILLTGCHITPNKKQDGEKKKYPKLVVVYSDAYGEDSSFSQVQEEINKITRKKLGVEVEFHLISDSNYSDAVELMLTSGEQVDILWGSNSLFVKAYVNRQLCDLEPLLKENEKTLSMRSAGNILIAAGLVVLFTGFLITETLPLAGILMLCGKTF